MGRHAPEDQESVYNFIKNLPMASALLGEFGRSLEFLADQADLEQPVEAALAAEIRWAASEVNAIAQDAETWPGLCRTDVRNNRDVRRVDDPFKGPAPEARGNVGQAVRDM